MSQIKASHKNILDDLLSQEANKRCADCGALSRYFFIYLIIQILDGLLLLLVYSYVFAAQEFIEIWVFIFPSFARLLWIVGRRNISEKCKDGVTNARMNTGNITFPRITTDLRKLAQWLI